MFNFTLFFMFCTVKALHFWKLVFIHIRCRPLTMSQLVLVIFKLLQVPWKEKIFLNCNKLTSLPPLYRDNVCGWPLNWIVCNDFDLKMYILLFSFFQAKVYSFHMGASINDVTVFSFIFLTLKPLSQWKLLLIFFNF